MSKKIRAITNEDNRMIKYNLIKAAISRYNSAIRDNYYLEAITLIESLICDRLESRLGEKIKKAVNFNTIVYLINKIKPVENDKILQEYLDEILDWSKLRNESIHEAVKIDSNNKKDFKEFIKEAKKTAISGKKIFDNYNKRLLTLRKIIK
jgi:hypothetical protein